MYAYTPKTDKWELLGDLNRVDLSGFTYDAKADRFYGLFRPFGSDSKPRVAVYSPKGAIVDSIELSDSNIPKALGSDGVRKATQLVVKSGKLAIITEDSIYALDLGSKKVNVTWTRK
jgi:hypothetical protein